MVFEVRVEPVGPGRADDEQQPGDVVVDESDGLRDPEVVEPILVLPGTGDALLENEQMPMLVVLLFPGLLDPVVDPPGQPDLVVHVGDRDVGDLLPGLVRHPGDELEHLELRERPLLAVERVEGREQVRASTPQSSSTVKLDGHGEVAGVGRGGHRPYLGAVGIVLIWKRIVVVSGRRRHARKTVPKVPKLATALNRLA